MEMQPVDRVTDLRRDIMKLNEDIERYEEWIREEKAKPAQERDEASRMRWERQIALLQEDKAALRAALEQEVKQRAAAVSLMPAPVALPSTLLSGGVEDPRMVPFKYSLVLRPVDGYEGKDVKVEVGTWEDLQKLVSQQFPGRKTYLYWCPGGGVDRFKSERTELNSYDNVRSCATIGGSVVWVSFEKSPQTSPTKMARTNFFSSQTCPTTFEDETIEHLRLFFGSNRPDDQLHKLVFSVPGSGKSTSVREAARLAGVVHLRYKLVEGGEFYSNFDSLCNGKMPQDLLVQGKDLFDSCKDHFVSACEKLVLEIQKDVKKHGDDTVVVVHVDEAQVAMGRVLVTRGMAPDLWMESAAALRSFVFPCLCDKLNELAGERANVRVVISGTNAFSSLVLNAGSQLKVERVALVGRFKVDWVMQALVAPHFVLNADIETAVTNELASLSANRRACWFFLCELWKERQDLSEEAVRRAAKNGCSKWSQCVVSCLGWSRAPVIRAWALLEFPEAYGGKRSTRSGEIDVVAFSDHRYIEEVRQFAEAGGVNVWLENGRMEVEVPVGCVRKLYAELVVPALHEENLQEVHAFARVALSVQPVKGHLLERVLACDLTMLGTPFFSLVAKRLVGLGVFQCDPLVFAHPFEYEPCIAQVVWRPHRVYCVLDRASATDRFVDVGCPLLQGDGQVTRVLFQVSAINDQNENWKKCAAFLRRAPNFPRDVLCYVSLHEFQSHEPRKVAAKGATAHDSRVEVLAALQNPRVLVLDGDVLLKQWFALPLVKIVAELRLPNIDQVTESASKLYVGDSPCK